MILSAVILALASMVSVCIRSRYALSSGFWSFLEMLEMSLPCSFAIVCRIAPFDRALAISISCGVSIFLAWSPISARVNWFTPLVCCWPWAGRPFISVVGYLLTCFPSLCSGLSEKRLTTNDIYVLRFNLFLYVLGDCLPSSFDYSINIRL